MKIGRSLLLLRREQFIEWCKWYRKKANLDRVGLVAPGCIFAQFPFRRRILADDECDAKRHVGLSLR